jgi:hypothetical protein
MCDFLIIIFNFCVTYCRSENSQLKKKIQLLELEKAELEEQKKNISEKNAELESQPNKGRRRSRLSIAVKNSLASINAIRSLDDNSSGIEAEAPTEGESGHSRRASLTGGSK